MHLPFNFKSKDTWFSFALDLLDFHLAAFSIIYPLVPVFFRFYPLQTRKMDKVDETSSRSLDQSVGSFYLNQAFLRNSFRCTIWSREVTHRRDWSNPRHPRVQLLGPSHPGFASSASDVEFLLPTVRCAKNPKKSASCSEFYCQSYIQSTKNKGITCKKECLPKYYVLVSI